LARRKPYLEPGTWTGYEINGRKRLVPAFGARSLGVLSVDEIRDFVAELAEAVEAGELAARTVNNGLGTLVVCLNDAVQDALIASNPALRVQRLPPAHIERDYLRLDEIPRYLDACSDLYRPLAEVLIGSGLRISEALGLRLGDLELKGARVALWKNPGNLTERQQLKLARVQALNQRLYRAYLLTQQLRETYRVPLKHAIALLDAWLAWARRCRLQPFVKLARTITEQRSGIEAAIRVMRLPPRSR